MDQNEVSENNNNLCCSIAQLQGLSQLHSVFHGDMYLHRAFSFFTLTISLHQFLCLLLTFSYTKCFPVVNSLADAYIFSNGKLKILRNGPKFGDENSVPRNAKWSPAFGSWLCRSGKTLERATSQNDLGVMISLDLKWKTQIYEQVNKANRMLGMFIDAQLFTWRTWTPDLSTLH